MRLRIFTLCGLLTALGAMLLAGCGGGGGAAGVGGSSRELAVSSEQNIPLADQDDPIPPVNWDQDGETPPPPPF